MNILKSLFILIIVVLVSSAFKHLQDDNPHGDIEIDCEECHNPTDWLVIQKSIHFDHDRTGFPLIGAHSQVKCRSCHESLVFHYIGTACIDCHLDIHKNELGFQCENCHTPENWENRQEIFDQHNSTRFPLLGAHAIIDCESCHYNQQRNEYKTTPLECYICHQENYSSTSNPDHQRAEFSVDCEVCHLPTANSWHQTIYQHTELFVLQGGHIGVDCNRCHASGYKNTLSSCEFCHLKDYNATEDPSHILYGFPTDCAICHTIFNWQSDSFDHVQVSGFELRGIHITIQCNACHINNQLTGLPRECYGCHETDFMSVSDPSHIENNFDHDCSLCHSTMAWTPAEFDHNETNFPLTGSHLTLNCSACHGNGYANTPLECFACHEADYNNTNDPNHMTAGFPASCEDCHNTNDWNQTTWDHDTQYFPIYSGAHQDTWNTCADCHVNASDYALFECIFCHEHSQVLMDEKHREENNYNYISSACYECHPRGRAED